MAVIQKEAVALKTRLESEQSAHLKITDRVRHELFIRCFILMLFSPQLKSSESSNEKLNAAVADLQSKNAALTAETSKLQVAVAKLKDATNQLSEANQEISSLSNAKFAIESEKKILEDACLKYNNTHSYLCV